jgi:hypothetical protein
MMWVILLWVLGIPAHSYGFAKMAPEAKHAKDLPPEVIQITIFIGALLWPVSMCVAFALCIHEALDKRITKWRNG